MARSKQPTAYAENAQSSFLFCGLERERVEALLSLEGIEVCHYVAGESLRTRESDERCLCLLLYGTATVEKRTGTGRILMSVLGEGDLFGAAGLFCERDCYVASVTANKSCWLLKIPEESLRQMLMTDFRVTENYLRYLTGRIRFLSDRLDGFAESSVEERLLHYLERHAENGVFPLTLPLVKLADALAISRATLYRALDSLEKGGQIERSQKNIILKEK